jgi:hypothetical protein
VKKICALSIMLCILFFPLASQSLISFGFGTITQFQEDPFSPETSYVDWIDLRNYYTGSEARLRVFGAELDGYVFHSQGNIIDINELNRPVYEDDISQRLFGMFSLGFSTEVASFTRLGLGIGTSLGVDIGTGGTWDFWMGDRENIYFSDEKLDFYKKINLEYRAKLDLSIGSFILSMNYQVPTKNFSYQYASWENLSPCWDKGKLGFSFISRFF